MTIAAPVNGYSARVKLELCAGDHTFKLSQIGGGRLVLKDAVILPGTEGEVIAHIDEHVQRWTARWEPGDGPRKVVAVTMVEKV